MPELPSPPPLHSGAVAASSNAQQFAADLPSVRRVYALQVIEKHMLASSNRPEGSRWRKRAGETGILREK